MFAEFIEGIGLLILGVAAGYLWGADALPHLAMTLIVIGAVLVALGWAAIARGKARAVRELEERLTRTEDVVKAQGTTLAIVRKNVRVPLQRGPGAGGSGV